MSLEPGKSLSAETQWAFNQKRQSADSVAWARAFAIAVATAAAAGIYTWVNRNPLYESIRHGNVPDAAACAAPDVGSRAGHSLAARTQAAQPADGATVAEVFTWIIVPLLATAVVAVALACALLLLLKKAATFMVYASLLILIGLAALRFVLFFESGSFVSRVLFAALSGLLCLCMHMARNRLRLVARLLSVASDDVQRNKHLVSVCFRLSIAAAVPLALLWLGVSGAMANGTVVANGDVTLRRVRYDQTHCSNAQGVAVACCEWQPSVLGRLVVGLVSVVGMWATSVIWQIQEFTVAGFITQHMSGEPHSTTLLSLRHATTVNFGSICVSAAVLALGNLTIVCSIVWSVYSAPWSARAAADAVVNDHASVIMTLFSFGINALAVLLRAVTQFATVQMAATGEPFLPAARSVVGLLVRQGLDAFTVWWLPQPALATSSFAIALLYVAVSFSAFSFVDNCGPPSAECADRYMTVFMSLLISAFFVFVFLLFIANIIKTSVDALYVRHARDLENGAVSKLEMHAVCADLPKPASALVVQPDAGVTYEAMEEGAAGPPATTAAAAAPPPAGGGGVGSPAAASAAAALQQDDQ